MVRRFAARLLLALIVLTPVRAWAAVSASANTAPLNLHGYISELEQRSSAVSALEAHPEQWKDLLQSLPPKWSIDHDGQHFDVSTRWLTDALDRFGSVPKERDRLRRRMQAGLTALHDEATALLQHSPGVSRSAADQRLQTILNRHEFQTVSGESLWRQIQRRVNEWLLRLLDFIFGPVARRPWVGRLLMWLAVAVAFVLIVNLLRKRWTRETAEELFDPGGLPAVGEGFASWRRKAADAASEGNYTEAVRCVYWAAIAWLGEAGAWRSDSARTPREYLRLLPAGHARRAPLTALTRRFEEVWYRRQCGTQDEFQDALAQLEALGCPPL